MQEVLQKGCPMNMIKTDSNVERLKVLLALQYLWLLVWDSCPMKGRTVLLKDNIGAGLTHLNISKFYSFCDRGYHNLSSLSNLEGLQLGHSWMLGAGPEKLDFMSALGKLQKLSITKCFVADDNLSMLQELKSLRLLGICECNRVKGASIDMRKPTFLVKSPI